MRYYVLGVLTILVTAILQIAVAPALRITSVFPNLLAIPFVFFCLGLIPNIRFLADIAGGTTPHTSTQANSALFPIRGVEHYKFRDKGTGDILRAMLFGFLCGVSSGVNSSCFWADVLSWTVCGFFLGVVSGIVNKQNISVQVSMVFAVNLIQGILFFIIYQLITFSGFSGLFFWRLLITSFYTSFLSIFIFLFFQRRWPSGIIKYED